jgi:hypothetical protein
MAWSPEDQTRLQERRASSVRPENESMLRLANVAGESEAKFGDSTSGDADMGVRKYGETDTVAEGRGASGVNGVWNILRCIGVADEAVSVLKTRVAVFFVRCCSNR